MGGGRAIPWGKRIRVDDADLRHLNAANRLGVVGFMLAFAVFAAAVLAATATPIEFCGNASIWQYWDSTTPPSAGWNTVTYDATAWTSGAAPLGYNVHAVATVVSNTSGVTTYYRKGLYLGGISAFSWTLSALIDDGAVVYVNGVEAWRVNMPTGTVTSTTPAVSAVPLTAETLPQSSSSIPTSMFTEGYNVIAVELHQAVPDAYVDKGFGEGVAFAARRKWRVQCCRLLRCRPARPLQSSCTRAYNAAYHT